MHRICTAAVAATLAALAIGSAGAAQAAVPSTRLAVGGSVNTAASYDLAGLQALPAITQTDTFISGTAAQTHTYIGASLWGVLNASGITTNPAIKNDVLNRVVVATGTDGYQVVIPAASSTPTSATRRRWWPTPRYSTAPAAHSAATVSRAARPRAM